MADYSGALKKFRETGYTKTGGEAPDKDEDTSVRTIKLTDEEAKELAGAEPGMEMTCEVTGKLEDNVLRVMTVKKSGGGGPDVESDAAEMMSKFRDSQAPVTQPQTMPSPS